MLFFIIFVLVLTAILKILLFFKIIEEKHIGIIALVLISLVLLKHFIIVGIGLLVVTSITLAVKDNKKTRVS